MTHIVTLCIYYALEPTFSAKLGQPVAWAIADVKTAHTYKEFFTAVKKRVPNANVTLLMTNDGKDDCAKNPSLLYLYFQILCSMLGSVNHLLCRSHR